MQTRLASRNSESGPTILTLQDIVDKTADLPSMPVTALAVMRETENPEANALSIARLLAQDQSLVVRVLRLANSAFYGLSRQVVDISDAVILLGLRTVKNLCLIASTYPWLNRPLEGYDLGPRQMWAHSLSVGVGAQVVAERCGDVNPDLALTAGILHDLGKTALSVWLENKVNAMARLANAEGSTFDQVERKVLGFDHQQVGAHMAEQWNLPSPLVEAMRSHHQPLSCASDPQLVFCVHLADYLSMSLGVGLGGDGMLYRFQDESLDALHLQSRDLDPIADEIMDRFQEQDVLFEEGA